MNKMATVLVAASAISAQPAEANTQILSFSELDKNGFNSGIIQNEFRHNYQIDLKADDLLKVSLDAEGKNFNFETLDQHSTVVPREWSSGVGNKDYR